jgi:hypothetical protein
MKEARPRAEWASTATADGNNGWWCHGDDANTVAVPFSCLLLLFLFFLALFGIVLVIIGSCPIFVRLFTGCMGMGKMNWIGNVYYYLV